MNSPHRRRRAVHESESPPPIRTNDATRPNPKPNRTLHPYNGSQRRNILHWLSHGMTNFIHHLPDILAVGWIMSWILGGCCSNVYTLEAIIKHEPQSGLLITFIQFLFVSLIGYYHHFSLSHPPFFLIPNQVPMRRWFIYTLLFLSTNVLNNYVFSFNISVPVHIILRSGGSVTTLLVGFLFAGKKFSRGQVLAVVLLTGSVIFSALSDADSKGKLSPNEKDIKSDRSSSTRSNYTTGVILLFIAQILSAIMGIYTEQTYHLHGRHWHETLFYSHLLSLPFFIPILPSLYRHFLQLLDSEPLFPSTLPLHITLPSFRLFSINNKSIIKIYEETFAGNGWFNPPRLITMLILNAYTQYVCIRGVNRLAAISTALSVTIVLNVRKLISLVGSCVLFGNHLAGGVKVGAVGVFAAGGWYAWEARRVKEIMRRREECMRKEAEDEDGELGVEGDKWDEKELKNGYENGGLDGISEMEMKEGKK